MNFAKISTNDVRNTMAEEQYTCLFRIALQRYASYTHFIEISTYSIILAWVHVCDPGYTCVSDLELLFTTVGSPIPLFRAYLLVISDQSEQPY